MKHWTTFSLFFSICVSSFDAENTTDIISEKPSTFPVARNILTNEDFGLPLSPDGDSKTTSSTTTETSGPEKTCPPEERWISRFAESFIECLCKEEGTDQQPCVLGLGKLFGVYQNVAIPVLLPRITATDLGFLYLWSGLGFQCHPFMGLEGLSIACYHEIGSFPISRDCRFSRSQYFCELLICVDRLLSNPRSQSQDFVQCIRRIPVPITTQAPVWHQNRPPSRPQIPQFTQPPTPTPTPTTTVTTGMVASLHNDHDDHSGHDHHLDAEHLRMDTIKVVSGVVGGILAGIFLTAVIFIICWCYKRRRQQSESSSPRPKASVRKQESAVYAEVGDTSSDTGIVNGAYLSNHAPDVISIVSRDEHGYSTLGTPGSVQGRLGRPPSTDSEQYSTIQENEAAKRASRSSIYNKLREDGKTVVCDHVYNRAQFLVHEESALSDRYDRVSPIGEVPHKTIMKKQTSSASTKKRVYFTLEPVSARDDHDDDDF